MQSRAASELWITELLPQKLSEMFLPVSLSRAASELGITKLLPQKLSEMFLPVSLEIDLPLRIADKTNGSIKYRPNRQRAVNRRASNPQQQQQLRCKSATTWDAARCIRQHRQGCLAGRHYSCKVKSTVPALSTTIVRLGS